MTAPAAAAALVCDSARVEPYGETGVAGVCADKLLACIPDGGADAVFLAHPAAGVALAATGVAAEIRTQGPARFPAAAAAARMLFADIEHRGDGPGPLVVGGFGFGDEDPDDGCWQGFPALRFVVPEQLWLCQGGTLWSVRTRRRVLGPVPVTSAGMRAAPFARAPASAGMRTTPASARAVAGRDGWGDAVRQALAAITAGELRKIVLARSAEAALTVPTTAARHAVAALCAARPECVTFWIRRGAISFVGSSPEVLARVTGGAIEATALAGTAPRRPDADEAAAAGLLACAKNRREHAFVADDVRVALARVCTAVEESPVEVRRYPEVLHLATQFRGTLGAGTGLLDAAAVLHPTSAVCGVPRPAARAMIAALEPARGWYAGGVGWMDAAGAGTLAVALRCGLLGPAGATLWAGAGIVPGSDPAAEWEEIETKLQAMRQALAETRRAARAV